MVIQDRVRGAFQGFPWLPCCFGDRVSLPLDKPLPFVVLSADIENIFNRVFNFFLVLIACRRWRWNGAASDCVFLVRGEKRGMENRVDRHRGGQVEAKGDRVDLLDNREGANRAVVELPGRACRGQITCEDPDTVPNLERGRSARFVSLCFHCGLGSLEVFAETV